MIYILGFLGVPVLLLFGLFQARPKRHRSNWSLTPIVLISVPAALIGLALLVLLAGLMQGVVSLE